MARPIGINFPAAIRFAVTASADKRSGIAQVTRERLKKLRVRRAASKAATKYDPNASSQVNVADLVRWANAVEKKDKEAVEQLVQLDATLNSGL